MTIGGMHAISTRFAGVAKTDEEGDFRPGRGRNGGSGGPTSKRKNKKVRPDHTDPTGLTSPPGISHIDANCRWCSALWRFRVGMSRDFWYSNVFAAVVVTRRCIYRTALAATLAIFTGSSDAKAISDRTDPGDLARFSGSD